MNLLHRVRHHAAFLIFLAIAAAWYLPWTWSDDLGSLGGDSAVYLLSARHYAPYLPADPIAASIAHNTLYPPLYPALLAASGGAASVPWAHAVTTCCLLAAFVALYALTLALALPRSLALAAVAMFAVCRGTYLGAFPLHSEDLYIALSLAMLALLPRAGASNEPRRYAWASIALAAALVTRSAGVALVPALGIALVLQRPRGGLVMLALALSPAIAWGALHRPEMGYGDSMIAPFAGLSPGEVVQRLALQASAFAMGLSDNFTQSGALQWALLALAAAASIVAARRFLRGEPDAWYFFAYLGLMILWPYPAEAQRFAWGLVPLTLAYALCAGHAAALRLSAAHRAAPAVRWVVPAMLAIVLIPDFLLAIERRFDPATRESPAIAHLPEWYGVDLAQSLQQARFHLALAEALHSAAGAVPAEQCVFAIKPSLVSYYTGRRGVAPPREAVAEPAFRRAVDEAGCHYFVLMPFSSPSYAQPYYPIQRLHGELEQVLAVAAPGAANGAPPLLIVARLPP